MVLTNAASRDYNLRSKSRRDDNQVSKGGLTLGKIKQMSTGRKSLLSLAQAQPTKDINEGKQSTIGRALRVKRPNSRFPDVNPVLQHKGAGEGL